MAGQYSAPTLTLSPLAVLFIVTVACAWLTLELIQEWCEAGSSRAQAFVQAWSWPQPFWRGYLRPVVYVMLLAIILVAKPEAGARFIYFQF